MLPVVDATGARTRRQAVSHTLSLLPISLCPFLFHLAGVAYLIGALGLGAAYLWFAILFARRLTLPGRTATVLHVHSVPAGAAGLAGVGQDKMTPMKSAALKSPTDTPVPTP